MGWFGKLKAKRFYLGNDASPSNNRGTEITATGTEINRIADGVTATAAEVNTACDGITATATELNKLDDSVVQALCAPGNTTEGEYYVSVIQVGDVITTRIIVDMTGWYSGGTADKVVGAPASGSVHVGQVTTAINGAIWGGRLVGLETPVGGDTDVDLSYSTRSTATEGSAIGTVLCNTGGLAKGAEAFLTADPPANAYLYFNTGTGSAASYTAGQYMIELYGIAS